MSIKAYSDLFVKYLFGYHGHEDILLTFINDVLINSGFKAIKSVIVTNPFNIQSYKDDKLSVLDIKAVDEDGKIFKIEYRLS